MSAAEEDARRQLWLQQRASRIAKRREIETAFPGDPAAAAAVRDGFQPLLNAALQAQLPEEPDEPESRIVANQNLNL